MTIDWDHFMPWTSLTGGVVLGTSTALFVLLNGRVLGISGILGGLVGASPGDSGWRLRFLFGLLCAPLVYRMLAPEFMVHAPRIESGFPQIVFAGLLVGIGTRYGAGCTSGHGICGLSRLSLRSVVATLSFMGAGFSTAFVLRHIL